MDDENEDKKYVQEVNKSLIATKINQNNHVKDSNARCSININAL